MPIIELEHKGEKFILKGELQGGNVYADFADMWEICGPLNLIPQVMRITDKRETLINAVVNVKVRGHKWSTANNPFSGGMVGLRFLLIMYMEGPEENLRWTHYDYVYYWRFSFRSRTMYGRGFDYNVSKDIRKVYGCGPKLADQLKFAYELAARMFKDHEAQEAEQAASRPAPPSSLEQLLRQSLSQSVRGMMMDIDWESVNWPSVGRIAGVRRHQTYAEPSPMLDLPAQPPTPTQRPMQALATRLAQQAEARRMNLPRPDTAAARLFGRGFAPVGERHESVEVRPNWYSHFFES